MLFRSLGVERGEMGREPGRDWSWKPRGEAGAVEGGEGFWEVGREFIGEVLLDTSVEDMDGVEGRRWSEMVQVGLSLSWLLSRVAFSSALRSV